MMLSEKIKQKKVTVGVIGLGYVGLPLAVDFSKAGINVLGFDISEEKCTSINAGKSYVEDISDIELNSAISTGLLKATTNFDELANVDCVSICVPTPLVKTQDPDMSYIMAACKNISQHLKKDQLIVLESTTYPGTTEEVLKTMVEEAGFEVGKDVFVAFSPERIDPGNKVYQLHNTPKVIGGLTANCLEVASQLYQVIVEQVVPVSSAKAAEMVKLLENTFRSVNIGLANEVAQMCHVLNLDSNEIINAAATKPFGFTPFYPGPGLGGHCIPIDPHYLSWKLKTLNYETRFIDLASKINTEMPQFVVNLAVDKLNTMQKSVKGSNILLVGAAYKKNISDLRESPSLDIIKILLAKGANVKYHDPYVDRLKIDNQKFVSCELTGEFIASQDLCIISTWHDKLDIRLFIDHAKSIIDARNATAGYNDPKIFRI
ncbi:MAG TPA: nucleotide sugar dehydrogenase [Oligoflexia bacterium]|nr:nucleotide sugar dehydrogenase [Oligoflexia bacterium]HMR23809.1 nucleotide sugar dehydrogenase [Oligoflexia bacterium]